MSKKFRSLLKDKNFVALALVFIFGTGLGLLLRILWIANVPTVQVFDFATFMETATNISEGRGHSMDGQAVAWVGPGYSYALAFAFRLFGAGIWTAKVFNVWLSTLTLAGTFFLYVKWLSREVPDKRGVLRAKPIIPAIGAAYFLTAVFPNLIAYNNVAGTESFFLFLLVCILLLQAYPLPKKWIIINFMLMGFAIGLAALTKPFMLAYPVVAVAMEWVSRKKFKQCIVCAVAVPLCCAAAVAPWAYRNYRMFDRFIPVSYNMGYNRQVNNNEHNISGSWMPLEDTKMSGQTRIRMEESLAGGRSVKQAYELEPYLSKEAGEWIRGNMPAFLELGVLRVYKTFFYGASDLDDWTMNDWEYEYGGPDEYSDMRHTAFAGGLFSIMVNTVSAAGLLFFFMYIKNFVFALNKKISVLTDARNAVFLNIAFFLTVVFAFEGQPRYNHPALIFLICAAVWICEKLLRPNAYGS
ncbi:MAG: hypothetical protein FWE82_04970 [Defluviitaleaceae bacterium]|nr:hypothetical protein [Defluviitaleaceae bacterium]